MRWNNSLANASELAPKMGVEVVTRYVVSHLVLYTLYIVDSQTQLTEVGPPSLSLRYFRRRTLLKRFHWLLVTEPDNRVSSK